MNTINLVMIRIHVMAIAIQSHFQSPMRKPKRKLSSSFMFLDEIGKNEKRDEEDDKNILGLEPEPESEIYIDYHEEKEDEEKEGEEKEGENNRHRHHHFLLYGVKLGRVHALLNQHTHPHNNR